MSGSRRRNQSAVSAAACKLDQFASPYIVLKTLVSRGVSVHVRVGRGVGLGRGSAPPGGFRLWPE